MINAAPIPSLQASEKAAQAQAAGGILGDGLLPAWVGIASICLCAVAPSFAAAGSAGASSVLVVAGFLGTRKLCQELDGRSSSLSGFYADMVRWSFPAIFGLLAAVLIAGIALLTPAENKALASSAITSTFFMSNWMASASSETAPLFHMWPIAVAAQLSLVCIPLVAASWTRFRKWIGPSILGAAAIFLAIAIAVRDTDARQHLYLSAGGSFCFLSGSALNFVPARMSRSARVICVVLGSLFLLGAAARGSDTGLLEATGGAALMLWPFAYSSLTEQETHKKASSWRLGSLTLSLYLWLPPFLALARILSPGGTSTVSVVLLATALVGACLCWRLVDYLRASHAPNNDANFAAGATAVLTVYVIAGVMIAGGGASPRLSPETIGRVAMLVLSDGLTPTDEGAD